MKGVSKFTIIVAIVTLSIELTTSNLQAQDIHFTMYDAMPLTINPATAGIFDGNIRAVMNYRSQWGSISNPFRTFSFGADGGIFRNKWQRGYLGLGLSAFKDVAGTTDFGTTKINLSVSSLVFLNNKNSASIGLSGSWAQNTINLSNSKWSSQFNGQVFDASLASNESFSNASTSYFDFSAGGLWAYGKTGRTMTSSDALKIQAGLAFYHVSRPSLRIDFGELDRLYSKWVFHTESFIGLANSRLAIKPKLLVFVQGPAREISIGTMFRYTMQERSKYTGAFNGMAISAGGYYRLGDAIAPAVELEVAHFALGVSYDVNVSKLIAATGGAGGYELYIRYQNPNPFKPKGPGAMFN